MLKYVSHRCETEHNTNAAQVFQSILSCDISHYILYCVAFSKVQLSASAFSEHVAQTPAIVNNITTTPKRAIVKQLN